MRKGGGRLVTAGAQATKVAHKKRITTSQKKTGGSPEKGGFAAASGKKGKPEALKKTRSDIWEGKIGARDQDRRNLSREGPPSQRKERRSFLVRKKRKKGEPTVAKNSPSIRSSRNHEEICKGGRRRLGLPKGISIKGTNKSRHGHKEGGPNSEEKEK